MNEAETYLILLPDQLGDDTKWNITISINLINYN